MKTPALVPPQTAFERSVQTAFNVLQVPDAGSTSGRPMIGLYLGQVYFDSSMGIPIWWNGVAWIDAAGALV